MGSQRISQLFRQPSAVVQGLRRKTLAFGSLAEKYIFVYVQNSHESKTKAGLPCENSSLSRWVYNPKDVFNCMYVNCASFFKVHSNRSDFWWSDFKSRWLSLASTLHHHFTTLNVVKIKFMSLPRQHLEEKSGRVRRRYEVQKSKHFKRHDDTSVDCRLHSFPFLPFLPLSPLRCTGSRWLRKVESKPKDKAASTWGEVGHVLKNNQKQTRTLYRWRCKNFTHHNPSFCKSQVQVNAKPHQATC